MSHNHTFRHAGSYKYRIALTFVKPRGGEGQNGQLKCPLGFLVFSFPSRCALDRAAWTAAPAAYSALPPEPTISLTSSRHWKQMMLSDVIRREWWTWAWAQAPLLANEKPRCLAIVTSHISLPRKFKGKLTNGFLANVYSPVSQREQIKTIEERKVCCML